MRIDFTKAVEALLPEDARSVFVTGDLGYNALEKLSASLGKRFVNAGVAEQNMVGFAAGLALSGFTPWVYSIAPFVTYRCLEQIRNDVCFHRLPVRLVGNGGGYTYGIMGSTHHTLEDMAVLKALPNMQLFFPAANDQVAAAVKAMHALKAPSYLRLAISPYATAMSVLNENPETLTRQYASGGKATVIGVGHAAQIALAAVSKKMISDVDVFSIARYPFNLRSDRMLAESMARTKRVVVVEEHYQGGSIAESLRLAASELESFKLMCPFYFPDQRYGSAAFHLKQCDVTPERLAEVLSV